MAECMIMRRGGLDYGDLACQPLRFEAAPGILAAHLQWMPPVGDPQYAGVRICRKEGADPAAPEDGMLLYEGAGNAYTDEGLTEGKTYHYRAFARNRQGLYQTARCVAALTAASSIPLANAAVGQEVQLKESDVWQAYLVAKHGYPTAENGRTLLLRKDLFTLRIFTSHLVNEYADSTLDTGCTMLLEKLDAAVQALIEPVEVEYTTGDPHRLTRLSRKVFAPSATEVGLDTGINANREGATLALLADHPELLPALWRDKANDWWLRTPDVTTTDKVFSVTAAGAVGQAAVNKALGLRPMLTLPSGGVRIDAQGHILI